MKINKTTQTDLNGKLIIAMSRSLQTIHRKSEELFRQNNITMAQFAVLEALLHKGEMTVGELIDAVLSSSGNMTVVVRNLERLHFVKREKNPNDNRSFLIGLTDTGEELIQSLFTRHMELVRQALAPVEEEEKRTIISILKKL